jgi:RNA polymerase sigma factor (sigma-70 family)
MEKGPMTDDAELLCQFAEDRSESAFAELVGRHVDLVYSAALRQCAGDHHRAQEVTQMVFTDLARKASSLVRHPVLPAWLHRSSRLAALDLLRREGRRHKYERAAGSDAVVMAPEGESVVWEEVGPVLDEAINTLDERDRQAILLRYFGKQPFGEVGRRLRLSENAARMRVERALEKLHDLLVRRGITSSAAALAAALSGNAVAAAPAGIAASTSAAVAVAGGSGIAWIAFMSTAKLPLALSAAILLGGAAIVAVQDQAASRAAGELADLSRQNQSIPSISAQNKALSLAASQARDLQDDEGNIDIIRRQIKELETKADAAAAIAAQNKPYRANRIDGNQPVFDVSRLDQAPTVMNQNRPKYPDQMRQAGTSGEAQIDFIIGSDGLVYNAYAVTFTDKAFADSAVQAVSQWVFKPGQVGGQNVYTHMQVPIVFTLSSDPPAPPSSGNWF